uniref:CUB-like domain-containing protein n=1 Tax=Panagrolaimus sp. PS1159 TaxID=55785 RepID=A0AC35FCB6_9BILA
MLLHIFLFVQIFIVFVYGQNSIDAADVPKIRCVLDVSTPTLHFDLSILQPNQQLIVATSTHFSIDMFLAGLNSTELKNYLFYEGDTPTDENLVGSLADKDFFYGNATEWYIPLLYSAKSKALTIVRNNETKTITNSVLFFRIPEAHKCGKHKNVAQPNSTYNYFIEYPITAPYDSICHFTIITFKQRPRRLVIQYLETNSSESIQISGSTFNESLDYFKF